MAAHVPAAQMISPAARELAYACAEGIRRDKARNCALDESWRWLQAGWDIGALTPGMHYIRVIDHLWGSQDERPAPEMLDWLRAGIARQRKGAGRPMIYG